MRYCGGNGISFTKRYCHVWIGDKDSKVIEQTLQLLDNMTLNKVLQSITTEELAKLRQKLTNQTFDNIVPEPLHERLLNRLSLN